MKRLILIGSGALLLSTFGACEPYLSLDEALTGKRCDADGCALGYVCSPEQICVLNVEMGTGSALPPNSVVGADGGTGGAEGGPEGSAGAPSSGGAAGADPSGSAGASSVAPVAGTGGVPGAAGTTSTDPDTGEEQPPEPTGGPDAGCVPQLLFRDLDGDGFGGNTPDDLGRGCPPLPGFATRGGDCHDAEPSAQDPAGDVFPGQTRFFSAPYPAPSGPSFDYDCSGSEEADPSADFVPAPDDCEARQTCGTDIGYLPDSSLRTGSDVNLLCGSRETALCGPVASGCALVAITALRPFRCR